MRTSPKILAKMGEQVIYTAQNIYHCHNIFAAAPFSHLKVYRKLAKLFNLPIHCNQNVYLMSEKYNYSGRFYFINLRLNA